MVLNTPCYKYLWLTMWFHTKRSKEMLKKLKSLILLCKFGSRAQKWRKIAKKNGSLNRNLLNFLYRYGIFWMLPGESSCPGGSKNVCQRGISPLAYIFYPDRGCLRPSYRRPKLTLILKSAKCGVTKKQIRSKFSKVVAASVFLTPYIFANVSQGTRMASSTLH